VSEQTHPDGPVVKIKLPSQVDDGEMHELVSYDLHGPEETPACVARILRGVADEFESADFDEVLEGDD